MKLFASIFLVAFAFAVAEEIHKSLEESKVFNVHPVNREQFELLNSLETVVDGVDFWQRASVLGREARVLVPKSVQVAFDTLMKSSGIPYEVSIENVEAVLENERRQNQISRKDTLRDTGISFTAYHRHAKINAYLDELAVKYPTKVTVRTLGNTTMGRDLKAIIISTTGGTDDRKPVIISDAGIHAREWIAPAQALYIITKLVEDVTESDIVENLDWVIIPLLNPDGYEYSHTKSRLWRKTRSTVSSTLCPGVDGNRNFDFQWMVSGSSSNPCHDDYAGPEAFSEPETSYLRDIIVQYKSRAKAYMAIHSHGSYILYPYGYSGLPTPDNTELHSLGLKIAAAIDGIAVVGSKKYLVGNAGATLYPASGASDDYAYSQGIKLSYTLELPGGGIYGFDLPPWRISKVVKESWQGIIVFARYIIANS